MTTLNILTGINDYIKTNDIIKLLRLKEQLEEQLRAESISKPLARKDKLIKNILKNIPEYYINKLGSVIIYKDKFVFCDSFRAYIVETDFGYKALANPVDVYSIFPKTKPRYEIKIDLTELKYHIAQNKANHRTKSEKDYAFKLNCKDADFNIAFNPIYLQEILQMYDTDIIYVDRQTSLAVVGDFDSEIYGIIFPVRI